LDRGGKSQATRDQWRREAELMAIEIDESVKRAKETIVELDNTRSVDFL